MSNKNIKFILFDLGGVLVRIYPDKFFKYIAKYTEFDEDILKKVSYIRRDINFGYVSPEKIFKKLIIEYKINLSVDEIIDKFLTLYIEEPISYMINLVKELKDNNYSIGLLSNTNELHINYLSKILEDYRYFDKLFFSHIIHKIKPDKEVFEYVLKELNISPQTILFIDDTFENIETAQSSGFNTLYVKMNNPFNKDITFSEFKKKYLS